MTIINHVPRTPNCRPQPRRPRLPLVECLPWCQYQDGHPNDWHADDQTCLSGHPGVDIGDAEVGAYAMHRHNGPSELVAVYLLPRGRDGLELHLLRGQALAMADEIRAAALLLPEDADE